MDNIEFAIIIIMFFFAVYGWFAVWELRDAAKEIAAIRKLMEEKKDGF